MHITSANRYLIFIAIILISFQASAGEEKTSPSRLNNDNSIDLVVQKNIDSIDKIRLEKVLLAFPYREYVSTPSEETFKRDACTYYPKSEADSNTFLKIFKENKLTAYKNKIEWLGPIVGVYFQDAAGVKHKIFLDQDSPSREKIDGYFDDHFLTASSSTIETIYKWAANTSENTVCDYFIKKYKN